MRSPRASDVAACREREQGHRVGAREALLDLRDEGGLDSRGRFGHVYALPARFAMPAIALAFCLSGAASLVYQVVWGRMLALSLGATAPAVAMVLAVFMAGLGFGSLAAARSADRLSPSACLRLYAALEITIAVTGLLSLLVFSALPATYAWLSTALGYGPLARNLARLLVCILGLLPSTLAMGATLPVLARTAAQLLGGVTRPVGLLYGANIVGALVGTTAAGFLLLPRLGDSATLLCATAGNVIAALVAVGAAPSLRRSPQETISGASTGAAIIGPRAPLVALLASAAATGALILGYEVLWIRTLVPLCGSGVHAVSAVLAAVLLGLALGSILATLTGERGDATRTFGWLCATVPVAGLAAFRYAPELVRPAVRMLEEAHDPTWRLLGVPFVLALPLVLPSTVLSGAALPIGIRAARAGGLATATARVVAANTAGAIVGALASGLVLLPAHGTQATSVLLALGCFAVSSPLLFYRARNAKRALIPATLTLCLGVLAVVQPHMDVRAFAGGLYVLPPRQRALIARVGPEVHLAQSRVLFLEEGAETTVVVEERRGRRSLVVGGKPVATASPIDSRNQYMLGHLPALLHRGPARRALVVGLGTGMTAGSVTLHAQTDVAELSLSVARAARFFSGLNHDVTDNPRGRITIEDGRTFLRTRETRYDIITVDPVHPYVAGAATLYTRDYFALVRSRLALGGIAAHWLPLYQLSWEDVRGVLASFLDVFDDATVYLSGGDAILVGGAGPRLPSAERLTVGFDRPGVREDLRRVYLDSPERLAATASLGPEELRTLTNGARLITDDHIWIEYTAPLHGNASTPGNLGHLLRARRSADPHATRAELAARRTYDVLLWAFLRGWRGDDTETSVAALEARALRDPSSRELAECLATWRGAPEQAELGGAAP